MLDMINAIELSEEYPVTIYLNGSKLITLMCTPSNLRELAIGHLINTGVVKSFSDIMTVAACEDMRKIYVIAENVSDSASDLRDILGTGCGAGHEIPDSLDSIQAIESEMVVNLKRVRNAFERMYTDAQKYIRHGGIHASAVIHGSEVVTFEDVARHNTHDKVVGYAAYRGWDLAETVIITTGRISADMVHKAIKAGVPIICSRSNPTTLAVDIAHKCGVTIIGRAMSRDVTVFTHKDRVLM